MRKAWLLATALALPVLALPPTLASGQTTEELNNDGKNTDNVLTQSMGLDRKSYSPLTQINKSNIKRLVPVWSTSLMNDLGELAAPVIYDGVMYAINAKWTFAIDVATGRQIWRTPVQTRARERARQRDLPRRAGDLQRQALSRHRRQPLVALDMKTGKELWNQKFADAKEGYYSTRRADRRQWRADLRRGRRRIHHARLPRRLGPRYRRKNCGAATPFRRRASRARRPGRRTATPGNTAAARPGARAPTIRSSIWSIGAPAMPSLTIRGRAKRCDSLVHDQRAGDPAEDRRDRLLLPVHAERRV